MAKKKHHYPTPLGEFKDDTCLLRVWLSHHKTQREIDKRSFRLTVLTLLLVAALVVVAMVQGKEVPWDGLFTLFGGRLVFRI